MNQRKHGILSNEQADYLLKLPKKVLDEQKAVDTFSFDQTFPFNKRDKTQIVKDETTGWYNITTPFVGFFNDTIEIYAKLENNQIILPDDGQTLANLELTGTFMSRSPKRKEWLDMILLNYGITLTDENELQTISTESTFPQRKFNMISDMAMMTKHTVSSLFKEDEPKLLDLKNQSFNYFN